MRNSWNYHRPIARVGDDSHIGEVKCYKCWNQSWKRQNFTPMKLAALGEMWSESNFENSWIDSSPLYLPPTLQEELWELETTQLILLRCSSPYPHYIRSHIQQILHTQFLFAELESTKKSPKIFNPHQSLYLLPLKLSNFKKGDLDHHTHYYLKSFGVDWSLGFTRTVSELPRRNGDCNWRLNCGYKG